MKLRFCYPNMMILLLIFQTITLSEEIVTLKPQLFFQEKEYDSNYIFSQPWDFGLDKDLNIYILDTEDRLIKKYDKDGKFIVSFGRKGDGPCEFRNLKNIQILNDRVAVFDYNKVHFFTYDGKCIKTRSFKTHTMRFPILYQPSDDLLIFNVNEEKKRFVLGLWNYDGKLVKEIASFYAPNRIFTSENSSYLSVIEKYAYDSNQAGEIIYAFSEKYEIFKFADGVSKLFIKENENAIPIPESDRKKMFKHSKDAIKSNPPTEIPDVEPPYFQSMIRNIIVDDEDKLWIESNTKEFKGYSHYSRDGKRIARYTLDYDESRYVNKVLISYGFLYFLIYDEETGLKIYRAKITV